MRLYLASFLLRLDRKLLIPLHFQPRSRVSGGKKKTHRERDIFISLCRLSLSYYFRCGISLCRNSVENKRRRVSKEERPVFFYLLGSSYFSFKLERERENCSRIHSLCRSAEEIKSKNLLRFHVILISFFCRLKCSANSKEDELFLPPRSLLSPANFPGQILRRHKGRGRYITEGREGYFLLLFHREMSQVRCTGGERSLLYCMRGKETLRERGEERKTKRRRQKPKQQGGGKSSQRGKRLKR